MEYTNEDIKVHQAIAAEVQKCQEKFKWVPYSDGVFLYVRNFINHLMERLKAEGEIDDYETICDRSSTTAEMLRRNQVGLMVKYRRKGHIFSVSYGDDNPVVPIKLL